MFFFPFNLPLLTEGLFIDDKEEGEWKKCLFYRGKKYKVEQISNYKNGELNGLEEDYDTMGMTLEQGELIFKTEYSILLLKARALLAGMVQGVVVQIIMLASFKKSLLVFLTLNAT